MAVNDFHEKESKWMLVVTELFNITVSESDAKKTAHYSRVLVVTELVVSGIQCVQLSVSHWRLNLNLKVKVIHLI